MSISQYLNEVKVGNVVNFHHTNGFIYKAEVTKITKSHITVRSVDYHTYYQFSKKTGIVKDYPSSIYIVDMTPFAIRINNKKMSRYYAPKALEYLGGELCFDKTPLNQLTSVQQGLFEDFIHDVPSIADLEEMENHREAAQEIAELYEKLAGKSKKELDEWAEQECDEDDKSPAEILIEKLGNILENWDVI